MSNEKLKFMDLLSILRVVDNNDRLRKFSECVEDDFKEVSRKVAEYNKDGKLVITIKFVQDKKSKNGIDVYAEITKQIPKGAQKNSLYRDVRTGGLYLDDPDQLKLFDNVRPMPTTTEETQTK